MPKYIQYDNESDKDYSERMQQQAIKDNREAKKPEQEKEPPVKNYDRYNKLYEGGQYPEIITPDIDSMDPKPAKGIYQKYIARKNSQEEMEYMQKAMSGEVEGFQDFLQKINLYKGKIDGLPGPQTTEAESLFTMLYDKDISIRQMKLYGDLRNRNLKGEGPDADSMFDNPQTFEKWYNKTGMLTKDEYLEIFGKYAKSNAQVLREATQKLNKRRRALQDTIINWWNR